MSNLLREVYVRWIRPVLPGGLNQQRVKLVWFGWGYLPLLGFPNLPFHRKLALIFKFLRIDWWVEHSHRPLEIIRVIRPLFNRQAKPGETMVEAGCWNGGSSAKFSLACKLFGYRLHIYDSFQGVEPLTEEEKRSGYDYSGEYATPEAAVWRHLRQFGAPEVCATHPGWFRETLLNCPPDFPARIVYIDCDTAKGTLEVLSGVIPALTEDGMIFSQDYQVKSVRDCLADPGTWAALGTPLPVVRPVCYNLAVLAWKKNP